MLDGIGYAMLRSDWEWVAPEDLLGRDPVDVHGAALAHLHLAEGRQPRPGQLSVAVREARALVP
ncbi:MAG: hypothetical protein ACRDZ3_13240 [Acidimicrobiia bacterium]